MTITYTAKENILAGDLVEIDDETGLLKLAFPGPRTVSELKTWFEENFTCIDGFKGAYFEIPVSRTGIFRITYASYGVLTPTLYRAEQALVGAIYKSFERARQQSGKELPVLFWRTYPEFTLNTDKTQTLARLFMRLSVPIFDLLEIVPRLYKPEGNRMERI